MATQTTNYKLHKFDLADSPTDITVLNPSMDIIDTQLKALADGKFDKTGGTISGNLVVNGSTTLKKLTASELDLNGNADVSGTLKVAGATTLTGKLTANGGVTTKALTATNLDLNGNGDVSGSLTVHGDLNAQGGLNVTDITATGATTLVNLNAANITATGTLKVNGATTLTGLLTANGGVTTKKVTATELDLNGNGDVSGNLNVGGLLQVTGKAIVEDIAIRGSSTDFAGDRGQIGDCLEATDIDFNDYTHSGVWKVGGTYQNAGAFGNVGGFLIVHSNRAHNYFFQIFERTLNFDQLYIRTYHGSSGWQPWRKVILETGGDLTGDLSTTGSFTSYNIRGFRHQYSGIDRDVIPSSQQQIFPYALLDKNGKTVSMYKFVQNTSGGIAAQIGTVRSGDDGETEYALVEIGFDSEGVGYANVPSTPNDANNNRAATSKFVNDRISAHNETLVHTTGSETIGGSKTFESPVVSKAVSLIQSTNWSGIRLNDTSRASDSTKMLAQILDADGKRWIGLETTASTDGSRTVQLIGRNRDDTAWLNFIKFWERADGTYNVYLARNPVTESNDNSIATTKWVRDLLLSAVPTGTILPFAGKTVPSGFLSCNKANVSRTTYAKLFSIIGTTYGSGDGSTTFTLPDYRNRFVMGANTASEVGTYLESGAPNITGWHGGHAYKSYDHNETGGAFYGMDEKHGGAGATTNCDVWKMGFDASLSSPIYGASDIIQPPAGKALWIIKT